MTKEFNPVNEKKIFFSTDYTVQILVRMKKIPTDQKISFHWYTEGNPDFLICTYEIPIKGKETSPRFAVAGVEIPFLMLEKSIKSFQKWYVLIELDGLSIRKEFEIKSHSLYTGKSNVKLQISGQSGYDWEA
ncbi:MAG: hypothetical protein R3328_04660 [Planococcaceae bacterium]|nr:hypothetical protein [Planococcaceae bacterium]